jgi:hypothetical protein
MMRPMDLRTWMPDGARPVPPPLWFMSDGTRTHGPLTTTSLVQGAAAGLPREHHVRISTSPAWRRLASLREVKAADESSFERKRRLEGMRDLLGVEALLRLADRPNDALDLGLVVAARRLGADFGFVHAFEAGRVAPRTAFAFGRGADGRLGAPLLANDTLACVARAGCLAIGDARAHHAYRVAASRLGGRSGEVLGVAMVPISSEAGVLAMLELGRMGHPFRRSDARALRAVANLVSSRAAS